MVTFVGFLGHYIRNKNLKPLSSYSTSQEILEYFKGIAHKYELYKYIKLQHRVTGATWSEDEGMWHVQIENLETKEVLEDKCHFLINGSGILK
jgi:cation diffusion facilitator CzcD-associated flavoprotein CzcO